MANQFDPSVQVQNVANAAGAKGYTAPAAPKTPTFSYKGPSSIGSTADPYAAQQAMFQAQIEAGNRQIAALDAQLRAAPKLPYYDINAGYATARQKAEAAVTPYYQKKFAEYAADFNRRRGEANAGAALDTQNSDIALTNLVGGNAIEHGRTAEDTAAALAQSANQEQQFQQGEGTAFDQQKRQLEAKTAASGLATSGLGQQEIAATQADRNFSSAGQVDAFQQDRKLKEQFKTRTFEDLARSDVLGKEKNVQDKKSIDLNLNKMINDLSHEESVSNDSLRRAQLDETSQKTQEAYVSGVNQFIASLQAQGARPQDIQAAIQAYR